MSRPMDVEREGQVRFLRAQGFGVRRIARELGTSPSTVSRLIRGTVDHQTLSQLTDKVRALEKKIALLVQGVRFQTYSYPRGHPVRCQFQDLLALLEAEH